MHCILQDTARSIDTLVAVQREVLTDGQLAIKELIVCIRTGRQTVEPRVLDGTLVVVVTS